jgi:hypothetical protein
LSGTGPAPGLDSQASQRQSTEYTRLYRISAASALNAITIFILYISSDAVRTLYRHPEFLWLICPILLYWLSRILVLVHRRLMPHDPVIFALTDSVSLALFLAMLAVIFVAI